MSSNFVQRGRDVGGFDVLKEKESCQELSQDEESFKVISRDKKSCRLVLKYKKCAKLDSNNNISSRLLSNEKEEGSKRTSNWILSLKYLSNLHEDLKFRIEKGK